MSDKHQVTAVGTDSLSGQIDGVCDRFEAAWKAGGQPRLADFLQGLSEPTASQAFRELLEVELAYRRRSGQAPAVEEYTARFPQQTAVIAEVFSPAARQPRRLGDYELLEIIGSGGMGVVYKARHLRLDRMVALKVLPERLLSNDELLARFRKEMQSIGRLNHRNIVQAHDAREENGVHFLVMELVDGISLDRLVKPGPLPPADACELVRQAAEGLQHAHQHQLVHRDIKPSNLILNRSGVAQIVDFGLARINDDRQTSGLTESHSAMGTLDYMAPEQFDDSSRVDTRADIYSLGCTLFNLLTGNPPYPAPQYSTLAAKMRAHCLLPAPRVDELRPEVPAPLAGIVERMLAKQPADRFAIPAEVAKALAPFALGSDLPKLLAAYKPEESNRPTPPRTDSTTAYSCRSSGLTDTHEPRSPGDQIEGRPKPGPSAAMPRRNRKLLAAGAGGFGAIVLGIILIIRGQHGEEKQKIELAPGDRLEVGGSSAPQPITPSVGTTPASRTAIPRAPLDPPVSSPNPPTPTNNSHPQTPVEPLFAPPVQDPIAEFQHRGGKFIVEGSRGSWSPDGTRMAFLKHERSASDGRKMAREEPGELAMFDRATGQVTELGVRVMDPIWANGLLMPPTP